MVKESRGPLDRFEDLVNENPHDREFFDRVGSEMLDRIAEANGLTREQLDAALADESIEKG